MKKYEDLGLTDFKNNKCWFLNLANDTVVPMEDLLDLKDDEPYITYVEYTLNNGDIYPGFMCTYDGSGNRVFIGTKSYHLSMYCRCNKKEADDFCLLVSLPIKEVFPIRYQSFMKCFGNNTGEIEISD